MKEARKFKVISSIGEGKEFFTNMEFNFVLEDDSVGTECLCLGDKFTITQNGKIFVLVNKDWVLTIQDITPVPEEVNEYGIIINPKLEINKNVEIFFETKEFEVKEKCTYTELYNFLVREWHNAIRHLTNIPFPLEMRDNNNLLLKDSWNIIGFNNISEGSFERQDSMGRSI